MVAVQVLRAKLLSTCAFCAAALSSSSIELTTPFSEERTACRVPNANFRTLIRRAFRAHTCADAVSMPPKFQSMTGMRKEADAVAGAHAGHGNGAGDDDGSDSDHHAPGGTSGAGRGPRETFVGGGASGLNVLDPSKGKSRGNVGGNGGGNGSNAAAGSTASSATAADRIMGRRTADERDGEETAMRFPLLRDHHRFCVVASLAYSLSSFPSSRSHTPVYCTRLLPKWLCRRRRGASRLQRPG